MASSGPCHAQRASGPSAGAGHPKEAQEEPKTLPSPEHPPPTGQVSSAAVTTSAATAPSASILDSHAALAAAVSHSFGDR